MVACNIASGWHLQGRHVQNPQAGRLISWSASTALTGVASMTRNFCTTTCSASEGASKTAAQSTVPCTTMSSKLRNHMTRAEACVAAVCTCAWLGVAIRGIDPHLTSLLVAAQGPIGAAGAPIGAPIGFPIGLSRAAFDGRGDRDSINGTGAALDCGHLEQVFRD